jgi:hypothetical protein
MPTINAILEKLLLAGAKIVLGSWSPFLHELQWCLIKMAAFPCHIVSTSTASLQLSLFGLELVQ